MGKRAALFTGQGAQKVGMGREACERCPQARELFDRAKDALGFDVARLCFEGPDEQLKLTEFQQPAIFVASMAAVAAWQADGSPGAPIEAAAGLSLGEYSALAFAGAIEFDDAARLVHQRGRFMNEAALANPGAMASVLGLDGGTLEALAAQAAAKGPITLANFNSPGQIVISGSDEAVDELCELARAAGAKRCVKLKVSGAFHSELMQPAADRLAAELAKTEIKPPRIPVIANVTAGPVEDPQQIRELLVKQLTNSVLWEQSMQKLIADGFNSFIEIGPGQVIAGLMRRIDPTVEMENYDGANAQKEG